MGNHILTCRRYLSLIDNSQKRLATGKNARAKLISKSDAKSKFFAPRLIPYAQKAAVDQIKKQGSEELWEKVTYSQERWWGLQNVMIACLQ